MGRREKPLRPGDNCPTCGSLLFPHCATYPLPCAWVKCRACGSYGERHTWTLGVSDAKLDDEE